MLDSLDKEETSTKPTVNQIFPPSEHKEQQLQSPSVSTVKKSSDYHDDEYDPTLTPVSSLSSDLFTDRTPQDKPLHVSELTKETGHHKHRGQHHPLPPHPQTQHHPASQPGAHQPYHTYQVQHHSPLRNQHKDTENKSHQYITQQSNQPQHRPVLRVGVQPALKELRDLENIYSHHQLLHIDDKQQYQSHEPFRLLHHQEPLHRTMGKENQPFNTQDSEDRPYSVLANAPPLLHHEYGPEQPFGRLMNALRQFNSSVRFPPIPHEAWTENRQVLALGQSHSHPSLFHPGNVDLHSHLQQPYNRFDIPERDSDQPGGSLPLLHTNWGQYSPTPRLIPPDQLLRYEEKRFRKSDYKKRKQQEKADKKVRKLTDGNLPQTVKLLKADLEPFGERDDRDLAARCV